MMILIISTTFFLLLCLFLILFTLGSLIICYALDHGWDNEKINKGEART